MPTKVQQQKALAEAIQVCQDNEGYRPFKTLASAKRNIHPDHEDLYECTLKEDQDDPEICKGREGVVLWVLSRWARGEVEDLLWCRAQEVQ